MSNITDEQRAAIAEAFPADLTEVFVVHSGVVKEKSSGVESLAGAVCTRRTRQDAEEVAAHLNRAYDALPYLKWVASVCFPKAQGGGDELLEASRDPEVIAGFEVGMEEIRKKGPIFSVRRLGLQGADAETFAKEVEKN